MLYNIEIFFNGKCLPSKRYDSANFASLHAIWFVPEEVGVRVRFLEVLQAEFEPASKRGATKGTV